MAARLIKLECRRLNAFWRLVCLLAEAGRLVGDLDGMIGALIRGVCPWTRLPIAMTVTVMTAVVSLASYRRCCDR
jgi:hypothetical protein